MIAFATFCASTKLLADNKICMALIPCSSDVPYDIFNFRRTCHYGLCQRCKAPDKIVAGLCVGLVSALTAVPSSLGALKGKSLRLDGVDDFVETPQGPGLYFGARTDRIRLVSYR